MRKSLDEPFEASLSIASQSSLSRTVASCMWLVPSFLFCSFLSLITQNPYHRSFSSLLDRMFLKGMDGATFGLVHLTIVSLSLLSRNEERDDLVVCTEHRTPTSRHQSRYLSLFIVGVSKRSVKVNENDTFSLREKEDDGKDRQG